MKGILLIGLLFFQVIDGISQKNFNYFKLCVLNENKEVLLVNFQDMWEPAGRKYDQPESMQTVLRAMAKEMGVEIRDLKLNAMITKYYGEAKYPVVFNYVTAQYVSGDPAVPPGCKDIKWYSYEEALKIIPFEGMKLVLNKVFMEDQDVLWAGSLQITNDPNSNKKFAKIKEAFYKY